MPGLFAARHTASPQMCVTSNPSGSSRRGTIAGLSGATCEHYYYYYKVLLDDAEALERFAHGANLLASAQIPANIAVALAVSRLTALRRPGAGVRGIATGDTFRRLVSRGLGRHDADTFKTHHPAPTSSPSRHSPALMLCLARCALPSTLMSSHPMVAVLTTPSHARAQTAPGTDRSPPANYWWVASGVRRSIHQGEGYEQGDALAPTLYALGQHDALVAADERLQPAECAWRSHAGSARRRERAYRRSCASIAERSEGVWTGNAPEAER